MADLDFTFTRDYRSLFKAAKAVKNIDSMEAIFNELASEVGIRDAAGEATQAAFGKAVAEKLNARDRGDGGKKL